VDIGGLGQGSGQREPEKEIVLQREISTDCCFFQQNIIGCIYIAYYVGITNLIV